MLPLKNLADWSVCNGIHANPKEFTLAHSFGLVAIVMPARLPLVCG
jgi:hypothetical protein